MISVKEAKQLALSMPFSEEHDHWGNPSFRVKGKKIFMTLRPDEKRAVFNLTEEEQALFTSAPRSAFSPVQGGWGRQGWTFVDLKKSGKKLFKEAMICSWCKTAPKKLVAEHFPDRT